ncbi:MAG: preprotein translocase subunit SecE [Candidatus Symbiobacter sp.]|nr:preprotein translocase subunit SecE [Candidatus Symbiobacter sp.]
MAARCLLCLALNFNLANEKMSKTSPLVFYKQVRQEAEKVTWPTRKETITSTIMVFIMVVLAALFFFAADQLLGYLVRLILGLRD